MHVVPTGPRRDRRYRSRPTKRIQHHIPAITVKFNQPLDQFLGERGRVGVLLLLRILVSSPWWIQALQKRLASPCLRRNMPERIGILDKLLTRDVRVLFVSLQRPRTLREYE